MQLAYGVLEVLPEPYIVVDERLSIVFANTAARDTLLLPLHEGFALDLQVDTLVDAVSDVIQGASPQTIEFLWGSGIRLRAEVLPEVQRASPRRAILRFHPVTGPAERPSGRAHDGFQDEAMLRMAVEAAEIGTFYCPMPLHKIVWNAKCKEHFWLPADAEVDIGVFYARLHPEDVAHTREAVEAAVYRAVPYDIEYRTLSPSGDVRWLRAMGRTRYSQSGEPIQFDGITIDITKQKLVEKERDRLLEHERLCRQEAQTASSLKDALIATVSHELRTPLNAIKAWTEVLAAKATDPKAVMRCVEVLHRNIDAQTRLVDDLLDVNRAATNKLVIEREPLRIENIVSAEVQSWTPIAQRRQIDLRYRLEAGGPVMGDAMRLRQIISNVLSNAMRYTPAGGHIDVAVTVDGPRVKVAVSDSGKGIPPEKLETIFEPFAQLGASRPSDHGGLGLGLAIARKLATLHGGTLTATSAGEGKGATFTLALPLQAVTASTIGTVEAGLDNLLEDVPVAAALLAAPLAAVSVS
ncbi:PAS domain-containing protein [Ralstonia pickettii]|uniref:histidine kinase n=1 Tax=Ralstonia pickettii TaxID=329 RepID=A0A7X2LAA4_RALPI|nr:HAMP domain-containing sensor histidine kinase [Ralstonia pickettii]MRS97937.1 PAS domain-containing protein [Ralstonia pickettii]